MKVSILVPVYGVEKYIERCAVCLMEQTYDNIEYIFVDDASPDRSVEFLQDVIKRYPHRGEQVKIVHHEQNLGLAGARTTAIKAASGDFLMHVDSDDWIEPNTVELCVRKQQETGADYIYFDIVVHHINYNKIWTKPTFKSSRDMCLSMIRCEVPVTVWGALIKTSLQKDNEIFPEIGVNMGEDYQQTPRLLYFAHRIAHLEEKLYHYDYTNPAGYCNSGISESRLFQSQRSYKIIETFCQGKGGDIEEAMQIAQLRFRAGYLIDFVKGKIYYAYYQKYLDEINNYDRRLWKYCTKVERIVMCLRNIYLVAAFVKIMRPVKHVLSWLRSKFC